MPLKPVSPKLIVGAVTAVGSALGLAIKFIPGLDEFVKAWLASLLQFTPYSILNWVLFFCSLLLVAAIVWAFMYQKWFDSNARSAALANDNEVLKRTLADTRRESMADVVTGLPDARQLAEDIWRDANPNTLGATGHLVLLDIVQFGKIDQRFGQQKGDALLRFIAKNIEATMRRDDRIYRMNASTTKGTHFTFNGDELLFLLRTDFVLALGFCSRIRALFEKMGRETKAILGEAVELRFRCALCTGFLPAEAESAKLAADDAIDRASYLMGRMPKQMPANSFGICWSANSEPQDVVLETHPAYKPIESGFQVVRIGRS